MIDSSSLGANVTSFAEKKAEKEAKARDKEKGLSCDIPIAVFFRSIADAINEQNMLLPKFPRKFFVTTPDRTGTRLILEEDDQQQVNYVKLAAVTDAILAYTQRELAHENDYQWTRARAVNAAEFWQGFTDPIEMDDIKPVRWLGEKGRTFRRLPWEYRAGDCPTWDSMTSRIQNGNALRAFIGSLLVPDSYNQQYLWIRGPGGDSKGAINRWLANAFGHSYASKRPPKEGEQFWSYGILGKRVVALPDADSGRFVRYGLWLSLTGGDPIEVEAKGQQSFTYQPNAKFIVISNKRPNVSSERAHQRRLLYCEMTGKWDDLTAQEIQTFEQKLWQEGGAFLAKCLNYYHQAYPNSGPIKAESSQDLEGWISVVEEEFETLFAHEFKLLSEQSEWVRPADMQRVLLSTLKQRDRQLEFLDWMERKHGVRKISIRCSDGRIVKVYQNITLKPRSTV